jgi:hypothetical protein
MSRKDKLIYNPRGSLINRLATLFGSSSNLEEFLCGD